MYNSIKKFFKIFFSLLSYIPKYTDEMIGYLEFALKDQQVEGQGKTCMVVGREEDTEGWKTNETRLERY